MNQIDAHKHSPASAADAAGLAHWQARAAEVLPAAGFGNFDPGVILARGQGSRVWDEDGNEFGYQDRADSREFDFGKAFLDILTDRSSRAGGMWRDAIRGAYAGTAQEAVGQSYWEYFFEMGEPPRKRSIAQETGKSEQLVGQHLKAIGKNIRSAIMSNSRLLTVLEAEIRATYGANAEISDRGVLMELFNPRAASTPPVHLRVFHILGI